MLVWCRRIRIRIRGDVGDKVLLVLVVVRLVSGMMIPNGERNMKKGRLEGRLEGGKEVTPLALGLAWGERTPHQETLTQ